MARTARTPPRGRAGLLACALGAWAACGGEPPPPPLSGAWTAVVGATEVPISLAACALTPRHLCPQGGAVERPGSSALARALADGDSPASFTFVACSYGQEVISGTLTTRLRRVGGRAVATGLAGRLRVEGAASGLCEVALHHAPTAERPLRHVGQFCGQPRELAGPRAALLSRQLEADGPPPAGGCEGRSHPAWWPQAPVAHPDRAPAF